VTAAAQLPGALPTGLLPEQRRSQLRVSDEGKDSGSSAPTSPSAAADAPPAPPRLHTPSPASSGQPPPPAASGECAYEEVQLPGGLTLVRATRSVDYGTKPSAAGSCARERRELYECILRAQELAITTPVPASKPGYVGTELLDGWQMILAEYQARTDHYQPQPLAELTNGNGAASAAAANRTRLLVGSMRLGYE